MKRENEILPTKIPRSNKIIFSNVVLREPKCYYLIHITSKHLIKRQYADMIVPILLNVCSYE